MLTFPLSQTCPGVSYSGDFLVFWVESDQSGVAPYRVDLENFGGNGQCDCPDFDFAKRVLIGVTKTTKRQALLSGEIPSSRFECKHIVRAKRYFTFCKLNEMIESHEKET
jgi:hypothetical protein